MLTIRHITDGEVTRVDPDELGRARARPGFVWVDLSEPEGDEAAVLDRPEIALSPLTIEDMRGDHHLPKLDLHGEELALTVHGIAIDTADVELSTLELDLAVRDGLLVSYHEAELATVTAVAARIDHRPSRRIDHPVRLLHLLLDTLTDVIVPIVEHLDRRIDVIEEDILTEPTETTRHDIYGLQRDVIQLRRAVVPQAEIIRRLAREPIELIRDQDRDLFRDVHDHLYRVAELSDSYRQLLDSALDSYRSAVDVEVNDMLNLLTMVSAVLLPLTVLAGIYGMNFENMPELSIDWAYPAIWGVFVLIVGGGLLWFHRRGWIGRGAERAASRRRAALQEVLEVPVLGHVLKVPVVGARTLRRAGRGLGRLADRRDRTGRAAGLEPREDAGDGDPPA